MRVFSRVAHWRAGLVCAFVTAAATPLIFTACGGGGGGSSNNSSDTSIAASAVIGADGGTVSVTDPTSPLFGVTVLIPQGALVTTTPITIRSVPNPVVNNNNLAGVGAVADFGPDGTIFQAPVVITLPGQAQYLKQALVYVFLNGVWVPASASDDAEAESHGQSTDPATRSFSTTTTHFTPYSVRLDVHGGALVNEANLDVQSDGVSQSSFVAADLNFDSAYLNQRCSSCKARDPSTIDTIVVHSTDDSPTAEFDSVINWAKNVDLRANPDKGFAHYYINSTGAIVQVVPDTFVAPHVRGNNPKTIGIELFRPRKTKGDPKSVTFSNYTDEQLTALSQLTLMLLRQYPQIGIGNIKRHADLATADPVTGFKKGDPYGWSDADWERLKTFVTPVSDATSGLVLPYKQTGTDVNGCLHVQGIDKDGTTYRADATSLSDCKSPIRLTQGNVHDNYAFTWDGSGTSRLQTSGIDTQDTPGKVDGGSIQLDPLARLTAYVSVLNGMKSRCGIFQAKSSTYGSIEAGNLSIEGDSVFLVLPTGVRNFKGFLPVPSKARPMIEVHQATSHGISGADKTGATVLMSISETDIRGRTIEWQTTNQPSLVCFVRAP